MSLRHFVENKKIFRKNICNLPPITLHTCRIKPTSPPSRLGEPWLPGGGNTLLDPRTPSLYRTMTPPHPTSHPTFPPADPRTPTLQASTRSPGAPSQTHTPQKPRVMCRRLLRNNAGLPAVSVGRPLLHECGRTAEQAVFRPPPEVSGRRAGTGQTPATTRVRGKGGLPGLGGGGGRLSPRQRDTDHWLGEEGPWEQSSGTGCVGRAASWNCSAAQNVDTGGNNLHPDPKIPANNPHLSWLDATQRVFCCWDIHPLATRNFLPLSVGGEPTLLDPPPGRVLNERGCLHSPPPS